MRAAAVMTLVLSVGPAATLTAQSLAAVAEREAERRKHTPQGKQYTNDELQPVAAPSTVEGAPAGGSAEAADAAKASADKPSSDASAAAESADAPKPPKAPPITEAEWRAQARERRDRIQKFRSDIAALETRLAEVERIADVSPEARSEREVYAAPLEELRKHLQKWSAEFERFERRARAAKIPLEWIH